jgi:hypothetical protein
MSTIKVSAIQDLSGGTNVDVPNAAKAWVNFNGTGTVAIRADYNVSSITDNGTGEYQVNFTAAMVDTNYSVQGIVQWNTSNNQGDHFLMGAEIKNVSTAMQTGSVQVSGKYGGATALYDMTVFCVSIFR